MSDARKRAEEALAKWDALPISRRYASIGAHEVVLCMDALRALLAEEHDAPPADAATEAVREAYRGLMLFPYGSPLHRKGMQRLCAALDAALSPAPAPSTDPWRACGCPNPDDCEHVFLAPAPSAPEVKP